MTQAIRSTPTRILLLAGVFLGGACFVYMVKLMHDISANVGLMAREMTSMSADMHEMRVDMRSLAQDVGSMRQQVATLPAIANDMAGMRTSMERLSGLMGTGDESGPAVNPMGVLRNMVPGR